MYIYHISPPNSHVPSGLVVRIPRSHRGGRGSIPRLGKSFVFLIIFFLLIIYITYISALERRLYSKPICSSYCFDHRSGWAQARRRLAVHQFFQGPMGGSLRFPTWENLLFSYHFCFYPMRMLTIHNFIIYQDIKVMKYKYFPLHSMK